MPGWLIGSRLNRPNETRADFFAIGVLEFGEDDATFSQVACGLASAAHQCEGGVLARQ